MNRFTLHIAAVLFPASLLLAQIQLQSAFPNLSFTRPVDIQAPPDSSNRLAVVAQEGIIYIFPNSSSVQSAKVFLDIRDSVQSTGNEEGLLGLAFHPDFKNNKHIFVNHTGKNPRRDLVARYTVSAANPDSVVKSSRVSIFEIYDPYSNHNAGQLAFGPDGFLYVGTGDGGSGGDPQNRAQNPDSLLGKMLRIDIDNADPGRNYAIPPTNPYYGMTSPRPEIWATGFRNPWRYSFDPVTGWLWAGDVGQGAWEEIDVVEKGKNYGWRIMEGNHCYSPSTGCNSTGLTPPVWEYNHSSTGGFSITGGYVYRGQNIPELQGKYVYADYVSGRIWFLTYDGVNPTVNNLFSSSGLSIATFGLDEKKELYLGAFDGKIYKFVKTSSTGLVDNFAPPAGFMLAQNYPNPFNPSTTLRFELPKNEFVTLVVYSLVGQRIKKLVHGEFSAGAHEVRWDGTNDLGQPMPTGVYLYRLSAGRSVESRRMILLK